MTLISTLDSLEYPINQALQNFDGTILDKFFQIVSDIPLMLTFFGVIIIYMIYKKHKLWKPLLFALVVSATASYLINEGFFKILLTSLGIFRPRPWTIHPDLLAIGHAFTDSSFPSSHMAFTTLLVMIVTYFEKRFLPYGIIIILIMGLSRIHNGMHYLSDVLIGSLMGIAYGLIGLLLMKKFGLEKKHWWNTIFH